MHVLDDCVAGAAVVAYDDTPTGASQQQRCAQACGTASNDRRVPNTLLAVHRDESCACLCVMTAEYPPYCVVTL
jgi:hypothetical protein